MNRVKRQGLEAFWRALPRGGLVLIILALSAYVLQTHARADSGGDPAPKETYAALQALHHTDELSQADLKKVIGCLNDPRGEFPGNTIAGEAAEILAEHPGQAAQAIPQLLTLLGDPNGYISASAGHALAAIERPIIENYLNGLSAERRKALGAGLIPIIADGHWDGATQAAEIAGMLGPESSCTAPALEKVMERCKGDWSSKLSNCRVLQVRCKTALRIIRNGWKPGDAAYYTEMRQADVSLGKPDPYLSPQNRFAGALKQLMRKMKELNIPQAYVLRKEDTFPFYLSTGRPCVMMMQHTGSRYLKDNDDGRGKRVPDVTLVILTKAARQMYRSNYYPDEGPPYNPLVRDFAFIDLGVNGYDVLDEKLRRLGIDEGYRDDSLYEFWPSAFWPPGGTIPGEATAPPHKKLLWFLIAEGKVTAKAYMK